MLFVSQYCSILRRGAEWTLEDTSGVVVGGYRIETIKYADKQAVIAESEDELQMMIEETKNKGEEFGMKLNTGKSTAMQISKQEGPVKIPINGKQLQQIKSFGYLGSIFHGMIAAQKKLR